MSTVNTKLNSGIIKFTFTDSDGEVFASFRMNPADVRIAARCEDASKRIDAMSKKFQGANDVANIEEIESEIESCFNSVLGYDASTELFGIMSATTVLPDGDIFARKVVETITDAIRPELEKRKKKMQSAVAKHTAKYNK